GRVVLERKYGAHWRAVKRAKTNRQGRATIRMATLGAVGRHFYRVSAKGVVSKPVAFTAVGQGEASAWTPIRGRRKNPVRFDPCRVYTWQVNARGQDPRLVAKVRRAIKQMSAQTGIKFKSLGRTGEVWSKDSSPKADFH